MTLNSQVIPKELLKFRLNKQLARLRQIFTNFPCSESDFIDSYSSNEEERDKEDKFQLYQRVLSWFIMGRLAKSEYDAMLEKLLITNELIEIHNKVIELLRAIYCDSGISSSGNTGCSNLLSSVEIDGSNFFNSFSFELNLLPAEEADLPVKLQSDETIALESGIDEIALTPPVSVPFLSNPKIKKIQTSVDNLNLTATEEALLAEALRNPVHELASKENDSFNFRKSFDIFTGNHRLCTEISSLPDQHVMKQRFQKIASNFNVPVNGNSASTSTIIPDSIAVLACKALEDYMKNVMENLVTLKCGRQTLLRPPISYIFPNEMEEEEEEAEVGILDSKANSTEIETEMISVNDLNLLFRMKPWLLADMEAFLEESFE